MRKLFLDDIRNPNSIYPDTNNDDWVIVRSYNEFCDYIWENGVPNFISFDHDLADDDGVDAEGNSCEKTGLDCVKWLIDLGAEIPKYNVHSSNPVGKKNIISLIENYKKHTGKER